MAKHIDMEKAVRLWDEGVTITQMCVALQTTEKTFQLIKRANPEIFAPRKKPVKGVHLSDELDLAEKLWKEGATYTEIAYELGKTRSAVSGMMNRNRDRFPERFGDKHKNHVSAKAIPKEVREKEMADRQAMKALSVSSLKNAITDGLRKPLEDDEKVHSRQSANALRKMFHGASQPVRTIPSKAENESYDQSRLLHAVSLMDLDPKGCKWPLTDKPYLFCGERRYQLKPWCKAHHERAWRAS